MMNGRPIHDDGVSI